MVTRNIDEKVALCLQELLEGKEYRYQAENVDELTGVLESVSLYLEERDQDFRFSVDGVTVVFQLEE